MWIRTQSGTLVNLDHVESIFVRGNTIVCSGHKYNKDTKYERILGTYASTIDAQFVLRLIYQALDKGEDKTYTMPEDNRFEN